jgi:hypothetical protein
MYGPGITVVHDAAAKRHEDFMREAKRNHMIDNAFGRKSFSVRDYIFTVRASLAALLLRTGSWMMPEATGRNAAPRGLELRVGR